MVWITDITHLDPLGPARRFAVYLGEIVAAASVAPPSVWKSTALRCRRRPKHRPCTGRVRVREQRDGQIAWICPVCDDQGFISNWQGSADDLSSLRAQVEQPGRRVVLSEQEYDLVRQCILLDRETMAILYGATYSPRGITLVGTAEDLDILHGGIAFEANHTPNRNRQRMLDGVLARIETAVRLGARL